MIFRNFITELIKLWRQNIDDDNWMNTSERNLFYISPHRHELIHRHLACSKYTLEEETFSSPFNIINYLMSRQKKSKGGGSSGKRSKRL
jgi:hypothetical protein